MRPKFGRRLFLFPERAVKNGVMPASALARYTNLASRLFATNKVHSSLHLHHAPSLRASLIVGTTGRFVDNPVDKSAYNANAVAYAAIRWNPAIPS